MRSVNYCCNLRLPILKLRSGALVIARLYTYFSIKILVLQLALLLPPYCPPAINFTLHCGVYSEPTSTAPPYSMINILHITFLQRQVFFDTFAFFFLTTALESSALLLKCNCTKSLCLCLFPCLFLCLCLFDTCASFFSDKPSSNPQRSSLSVIAPLKSKPLELNSFQILNAANAILILKPTKIQIYSISQLLTFH